MDEKEPVRVVDKIKLQEEVKPGEPSEWVIGTPPAVKVSSPGFSTAIQIRYNNQIKKEKEEAHYHTDNIAVLSSVIGPAKSESQEQVFLQVFSIV